MRLAPISASLMCPNKRESAICIPFTRRITIGFGFGFGYNQFVIRQITHRERGGYPVALIALRVSKLVGNKGSSSHHLFCLTFAKFSKLCETSELDFVGPKRKSAQHFKDFVHLPPAERSEVPLSFMPEWFRPCPEVIGRRHHGSCEEDAYYG